MGTRAIRVSRCLLPVGAQQRLKVQSCGAGREGGVGAESQQPVSGFAGEQHGSGAYDTEWAVAMGWEDRTASCASAGKEVTLCCRLVVQCRALGDGVCAVKSLDIDGKQVMGMGTVKAPQPSGSSCGAVWSLGRTPSRVSPVICFVVQQLLMVGVHTVLACASCEGGWIRSVLVDVRDICRSRFPPAVIYIEWHADDEEPVKVLVETLSGVYTERHVNASVQLPGHRPLLLVRESQRGGGILGDMDGGVCVGGSKHPSPYPPLTG